MLHSLPPELVRQIIESSIPHKLHSWIYRDRQALLRTLCLVCHLFRDIAQPLLREIVSLRVHEKLKTAQECEELLSYAWAVDIRQVEVKMMIKHSSSTVLLEKLVASCSNLETLDLAAVDHDGTELGIVTRLSNLRSLRLFCLSYKVPTSSFSALQSLTINAYRNPETIQNLLHPSHFPSLRALAFSHATGSSLLDISAHPPCRTLFEQLDALFVPVAGLSQRLLVEAQPLLEKTLIHIHTSTDDASLKLALKTQHVRDHSQDFRSFARIILATKDCNLRSLYLAHLPQAVTATHTSVDRSGTDELLSACHKRKVEVIFEEQVAVHPLEPVISPEFWKRQREVRRSILAGVVEGVELNLRI